MRSLFQGITRASLNCPENLLVQDEIDFIYPTKTKTTPNTPPKGMQSQARRDIVPGTIPLELLGHDDSRRVLRDGFSSL